MKEINELFFIRALKDSIDVIRKNKGYFSILFITQLAFMIIMSITFVHFSIQIGQDAQQVIAPLQETSPEVTPLETTKILEDAAVINSAYKSMVQNIILFLVLGFLIYVFLNGITWDIANVMVNGDSSFLKYELMFGISIAVFTFFTFLVSGIFLRLLTYIGYNEIALIVGLLLYILITYFAYISFGLINKYNVNEIGKFVKHTVFLGYKKFKVLIFSYLFMSAVILLFAGLVYQMINAPIPAMFLGLVLLIVTFNWGRIYFLVSVRNAGKNFSLSKFTVKRK